MPRPKKSKEEVKPMKPIKQGVNTLHGEPITEEQFERIYNYEPSPLEELQKLEKKLRACTDETPRDIRYKIECNRFILVLQYNSIEVRGDVFYPEMLKGIYIDSRKSELATAQKMLEVLKEWRGE